MIEQFKSLFEILVSELPSGTAKVNFYRVPRGDGSVVEVLPSNQESASFGVHVDDGGEYVTSVVDASERGNYRKKEEIMRQERNNWSKRSSIWRGRLSQESVTRLAACSH